MKLIELQDVDVKLDQLQHKLKNLPETQTVADLESRYSDLEIQVGTAQAKVSDTGRDVKKAEAAVEQVRARIQKDQDLLNSGSVTVAKQLEELQHEVGSLERRQANLEDEQLEVMQAAEEAENTAASLTESAAKVAADLTAAKEKQAKAQAELNQQIAVANRDRSEISDELGMSDISKLYSKLRTDHGGVVAAMLKGGRCGACNLELSPVDLKGLKESEEDDVHRCDECRSILVLGDKS